MTRIEDFKFSADVSQVFDDMVDRSVPFYSEVQRMITEMSESFLVDGTNIYDLGCSTGTTLALTVFCFFGAPPPTPLENNTKTIPK